MARTAPVPNFPAIPGMNPGLFVLGGGGAGGGSGAGRGKGKGGKQRAGGKNGGADAKGGGKGAPDPKKYPKCGTASHPVDVATGRAFTHPILVMELGGPLPLRIERSWSSSASHIDVGLGWGWAWSLGWRLEVRRRSLHVWTDLGTRISLEDGPDVGQEIIADFGVLVRREAWGYRVDTNDDRLYLFAEQLDEQTWALTSIIDRNGNQIRLTYQGGKLTEVQDSAGRVLRIRRTPGDHIASIEHRNAVSGGQWIAFETYDYDEHGNMVRATDADGFCARYGYDPEHRLTSDTDRSGLRFQFRYDEEGRCVESWGDYPGWPDPSLDAEVPAMLASGKHPAKGIHHCVFEYLGELTHVIDSTFVRTYEVNEFGLLLNAHDAGPAPARAEYDERGFLTAEEGPDGGVELFERDARGNLLKYTSAIGHVTTITRDERCLPLAIEDPLGGVTRMERDAAGNTVRLTNPLGEVTSFRYDGRGLLVERIEPNGAVSNFEYDEHGNLVRGTQPDGAVWQLRYDYLGRLTSRTDPLGAETRYAYSARGDRTAEFDAAGLVTRCRYDGERHLIAVQDAAGHVTELTWGGYHKLCERRDANGGSVRLFYNREGELTRVRNERGEEHRFTYDIYGRLIGERTFDGRIFSYRLDAAGRPVRVVQGDRDAAEGAPDLARIDVTYDLAGNIVERAFAGSKETFVHDALGNVIEMHSDGASVVFERDALGRVVREVQTSRGESIELRTRFDAIGRRVERRTSLGHVEEVTRDLLGTRVSTRLDGDTVLEHVADPLGREVVRRLPHGGRIETTFDRLGHVTQRRAAGAPGPRRRRPGEPAWIGSEDDGTTTLLAYKYDPLGEVTARHDSARGTVEYRYDPAGQLVAAISDGARREALRYDAAGNVHEGDGAPAREYTPGNHLLRKSDTAYRWDSHGRLIEKREPGPAGEDRVWRYEWSEAGLLSAAERSDGLRVELEYDAIARRTRKRVLVREKGAGALRLTRDVRFVWDDDVLVHELTRDLRAAAERAGDPVVEVRTYCFEDDSWAPAAHRVSGGEWVHYLTDAVGAPERLIDAEGSVKADLVRRPFSIEEVAGDKVKTPLRFAGQYEDVETSLCYNRYRYYDPAAGRFISADPAGLDGGLNVFAVEGSTTSHIDPLGLWSQKDVTALQTGPNNTVVTVKSKKEADELLKEAFPGYQKVNGVGHQEPSGARKKRKMDRFKKGGAYHKDYAVSKKTGRVCGHEAGNPHGAHPHINIKRTDGVKVEIRVVP
jgi:RHS repeat-associated protein